MSPMFEKIGRSIVDVVDGRGGDGGGILGGAKREAVEHMLPAFYLSCSEIMNKWEDMVSTKGSCELDVCPYLETLSSDAISRTAFGNSYRKGRKIFQLQKEQAELAIQATRTIYISGLR
ncbi:hypothetical protein LguiB_002065 [Lonicera macranthoides]